MPEDVHLPDATRTVASFDTITCDGCQRETHISTRIGGEAACRCGRVHVTAGILIVSKGDATGAWIGNGADEADRIARANAREPRDPNESPPAPAAPPALTGNVVSFGATMDAGAALNTEVAPQ